MCAKLGFLGTRGGFFFFGFVAVGWIEKNEIKWLDGFFFQSCEGGDRVGGNHANAFCNIERCEIFADEADGFRMMFHEGDKCGAATDGFDTDGAGAGEKIEEAGAVDTRAENIEKGFAEHVAGRTESESFE